MERGAAKTGEKENEKEEGGQVRTRIWGLRDFLLAVAEEEELESGGDILFSVGIPADRVVVASRGVEVRIDGDIGKPGRIHLGAVGGRRTSGRKVGNVVGHCECLDMMRS